MKSQVEDLAMFSLANLHNAWTLVEVTKFFIMKNKNILARPFNISRYKKSSDHSTHFPFKYSYFSTENLVGKFENSH